jgi:pilus assembly protein CpaE
MPQLIAFCKSSDIHQYIDQLGQYFGVIIEEGGVDIALQSSQKYHTAELVIVDIRDQERDSLPLKDLRESYSENTIIILVGTSNDIKLYRYFISAEMDEYVVPPFTADEIIASYQDVLQQQQEALATMAAVASSDDKIQIMVVGSRGGVGVTMCATNVAYIIAEEMDKKVTLIDMDMHFGNIALSLDIEPSVGFREAMENPSRIDSTFIRNILVPATENLSVIAAEEDPENFVAFDEQALHTMFDKIREHNDYIVIDAPRSLPARFPSIVNECSHLVVMTELSIVGLRDTIVIIEQIRRIAPDIQVEVVVNRYHPKRAGLIHPKDFAKEVGRSINILIPDEPEVASVSMNEGKSISKVSKSSNLYKALKALCTRKLDPKLIKEGDADMDKGSLIKKMLNF